MPNIYLARKIGADDVVFGQDNITYVAPDGSVRTISPINAKHIPFESQNGTIDNLVDKSFKISVYPLNLVVAQTVNYADDAGTPNNYSITLAANIPAYVKGQQFTFKALNTNTGASTLNVNGLGSKYIKCYRNQSLTNLASGDIRAGQIITVVYDGTNFIMVNPTANAIDNSSDLVTPDEVQNQIYEFWWNQSITDSYVINPDPPITSYHDGQRWCIYTQVGNTGACTLSVSGLAPIPIRRMYPNGVVGDLETGDILANEIFVVVYSSSLGYFILLNTRTREFAVNSYYYTLNTNVNPSSLLHYGTWQTIPQPYMGLFHFDSVLFHHDYHGYIPGLISYSGNPPLYSTNFKKFGPASLEIPNNSSTVYIFNYMKSLSYGFQVDFWIRYSGTGIAAHLWNDHTGVGTRYRLESNRLRIYEGGTLVIDYAAPSTSTWHHTAMGVWFDSGFWVRLWLNGSVVAAGSLNRGAVLQGWETTIFTRTDNTSQNLYIDELRIVDDILYGDTYTVPTSAYTPLSPPPRLWRRTA